MYGLTFRTALQNGEDPMLHYNGSKEVKRAGLHFCLSLYLHLFLFQICTLRLFKSCDSRGTEQKVSASTTCGSIFGIKQ